MPSACPKVFAVLLLGTTLVTPGWGQDPFMRPQARDQATGPRMPPHKGQTVPVKKTEPVKKKGRRPRPGVEGLRQDDRSEDRPADLDAPLSPPAPPDESETAVA
jgi:hypothetical protein